MKFRKTVIQYCGVNVTLTLVNHKYFYKEHVIADSYDINENYDLVVAFRDFLNCNTYERILFELVAENHKTVEDNAMTIFFSYRGHKLRLLRVETHHELNGVNIGYVGLHGNTNWIEEIDKVVFNDPEKQQFLKDYEERKASYKLIFDKAVITDVEDRLRRFTHTENCAITYPSRKDIAVLK